MGIDENMEKTLFPRVLPVSARGNFWKVIMFSNFYLLLGWFRHMSGLTRFLLSRYSSRMCLVCNASAQWRLD